MQIRVRVKFSLIALETSALLVGSVCMAAALLALTKLEETFHKDLESISRSFCKP
jgi:heme/copper-type cytochrome/quinol oxidase subunit 3